MRYCGRCHGHGWTSDGPDLRCIYCGHRIYPWTPKKSRVDLRWESEVAKYGSIRAMNDALLDDAKSLRVANAVRHAKKVRLLKRVDELCALGVQPRQIAVEVELSLGYVHRLIRQR